MFVKFHSAITYKAGVVNFMSFPPDEFVLAYTGVTNYRCINCLSQYIKQLFFRFC